MTPEIHSSSIFCNLKTLSCTVQPYESTLNSLRSNYSQITPPANHAIFKSSPSNWASLMVSGLLFTPCRAVWIHRFLCGAGSPELGSEPCQQFRTCLGCNKGCSWLLCSREWDFIFACCSKENKTKDKQRDYLAKWKMAGCWLWRGHGKHSPILSWAAQGTGEFGERNNTANWKHSK